MAILAARVLQHFLDHGEIGVEVGGSVHGGRCNANDR
jgi:hypothetical protein